MASLVGFVVAAQFVSLDNLEIPYYVVVIGAGVLKLASVPQPAVYETEFIESWAQSGAIAT
jgi:hypothetical protein